MFDIDQRQKLKSHLNTEDVVFWKWINEQTVGLVTETSVYHWNLEGRRPGLGAKTASFRSEPSHEGVRQAHQPEGLSNHHLQVRSHRQAASAAGHRRQGECWELCSPVPLGQPRGRFHATVQRGAEAGAAHRGARLLLRALQAGEQPAALEPVLLRGAHAHQLAAEHHRGVHAAGRQPALPQEAGGDSVRDRGGRRLPHRHAGERLSLAHPSARRRPPRTASCS